MPMWFSVKTHLTSIPVIYIDYYANVVFSQDTSHFYSFIMFTGHVSDVTINRITEFS